MTARKCKVFVVGEGPDDIGDLGSPYAAGRDGFLQPLIRKLAGGVDVEIVGRRVINLGSVKAKGHKLKGHGPKLFAAAAAASAEGADVLVFVHDADRAGVRPDLKTEYAHLAEAEEAVSELVASPPFIVAGLAVCAIEAWAMGDVEAWKSCAGGELPAAFPRRPEELWGKRHEPASNHPHQIFSRMRAESRREARFADLAEATDVDTLARACPSFGRLKKRAEAARSSCKMAHT